jgi:hypothetical protein
MHTRRHENLYSLERHQGGYVRGYHKIGAWWGAVYKVGSCQKRLIPIFYGHRSVSKKGKTHLNDVSMFALSCPILLVDVGARDMVCDANGSKKELSFSYPPP